MTRAVIIGCGNIAQRYAADLLRNGTVELIGYHDVDPARASSFATEYGGRAFTDLDEAIDVAELVINLTIFEAHYPVNKVALSAGRHVYTEKPLALRLDHALELGELAQEHGVRLASAPFTFMGPAQDTAIDWIRSHKLGPVRIAYAEVNHGRIETWHPNPEPFYAAGPILDVGVYPLAILLAAFGPVASVRASSSTLLPDRHDLSGHSFTPGSPDYWLVELTHSDGARVRLTVNFYVYGDEGITFHGDEGSLELESWFSPNSGLTHIIYGGDPERVDIGDAPSEVDWSVGVAELVAAIEEHRPSRLSREQAVHMVDILHSITVSATTDARVDLTTTFQPL